MIGRHIRQNAVAQIRDVPDRTEGTNHRMRATTNIGRRSVQRTRIEVALHGDAERIQLTTRILRRRVPVHTDRVGVGGSRDLRQRPAGSRCEDNHRDPRFTGLVCAARKVRQRKRAELVGAQGTGPRFEQLHDLRSGRDLRHQVLTHRVGDLAEQGVRHLGVFVQHALGDRELLRAFAFDHVGRERPRRASEPDEGHFAVDLATGQLQGVEHVRKMLLRIHGVQLVQILERAERGGELRADAFIEREVHAHGFGDDQNVAEDDRGIHANEVQRLQRDFHGQLRRAAHRQEVRLRTNRAILRQIPSCLAHHPHRRALDGLTPERAEEQIIRRQ